MSAPEPSVSTTRAASVIVHVTGSCALVGWSALAFASRSPKTLAVATLFVALAAAWAALLICWRLLDRRNLQPSWKAITGWAALFRLVAFLAQPTFEDDYHRYLWDGWRFLQTGDPYDSAPAAHFSATNLPPALSAALDGINHPELPTPYSPTCQMAFAAAAWLSPGSLWSLKLLLLGAEAAFLLAGSRLMTARNFLLLAWAPLLVHEVGFNVHPDVIGLALLAWVLVLGRSLAQRNSRVGGAERLHRRQTREFVSCLQDGDGAAHHPCLWRSVAVGALLGLMISARPFSGLLAALVILVLGKHSVRAALIAGVAASVTTLLLHLPFLSAPGEAGLASIKTMADGRMFNALVAEAVLRNLPVSTGQALLASGLIVSVSLTTWLWWRRSKGQESSLIETLPGAAVMGLFLLWSPAINPWYALWILPFAAIRPRAWSWTALIVVSLSYATLRNVAPDSLEGYRLLGWVQPAEVALIMASLIVDGAASRKRVKSVS